MNIQFDFKKLKTSVKRIPNQKRKQNALFKQHVNTKGEIYLYENVIIPFLRDKIPDASKLDLSAFTMDDLESIEKYYSENIGECSENHNAIKPFYDVFLAEKPKVSSVAFL